MGNFTGFLESGRELPARRPVPVRLRDWREVYEPFPTERLRTQASRCMDCGIPFCNDGCPLGNLIPDWNDLVFRDHWHAAIERLHATNNFPEFTGRLCPAPCESACVLGINSDPVTIKQVEVTIIDRAWEEGWVTPVLPSRQTGRRVAVVGSGPAGLAAAQQLTRAGHTVAVYERDDQPGGLLRYGIPEFKLEKRFLDRRLEQMRAEGTTFVCNVNVGAAAVAAGAGVGDGSAGVAAEVAGARRGWRQKLLALCRGRPPTSGSHDAVVLAVGATVPRDLVVPGRELQGIHQAMEFLPLANRVVSSDDPPHSSPISAAGKRVVIIGGGDTGADCLGTVHRQGALSVTSSKSCPGPRRPGSVDAVAHVAIDVPDLLGPRGGWRTGLLGQHHGVPRRRRRSAPEPPRVRGGDGRRRRAAPLRAGGQDRVRAAMRAGPPGPRVSPGRSRRWPTPSGRRSRHVAPLPVPRRMRPPRRVFSSAVTPAGGRV